MSLAVKTVKRDIKAKSCNGEHEKLESYCVLKPEVFPSENW